MRVLYGFLFLLFSATGMSAAIAQEAQAASAITPAGFQFAGTWDCAGAFRNGKVHRSIFMGSLILGGTWLELTEQDVEPATGYLAKYLIGYDPRVKHLVEFDANNSGAATYESIGGWQNSVLIMTSSIMTDSKGLYVGNRYLYSVVNQDTFTVDWQVSKSTYLSWTPADHLVCKRRVA